MVTTTHFDALSSGMKARIDPGSRGSTLEKEVDTRPATGEEVISAEPGYGPRPVIRRKPLAEKIGALARLSSF